MVFGAPQGSSRDIPPASCSHEASLAYCGVLGVHEEIQNGSDVEWKDSGRPWSPK